MDIRAAPDFALALSGALAHELADRVVEDYTSVIADLALAAAEPRRDDARAAVLQVQARLRALADAHRVLRAPSHDTQLDLTDYLEHVCRVTAKARALETRVTLYQPGYPLAVPATRAWRVGIIVGELIIAAARRGAEDGEISVDLRAHGASLICTVANPSRPGAAPAPHSQALVQRLARELTGRFETREGGGRVATTLIAPIRPCRMPLWPEALVDPTNILTER